MLLTDLPDDIIYTVYDNSNLIDKIKLMYLSKKIHSLTKEMVHRDVEIFIDTINNLQRIDTRTHYCFKYYKHLINVDNIIRSVIDNDNVNNNGDDRNIISDLVKIYSTGENDTYEEKYVEYYAYFGNKKILQKMQTTHNIKDDYYICAYIAGSGSLEMLQWAHENGYMWNERTCMYASANGHLSCLIYAHKYKCPWTVLICDKAAENGHLDCLIYAHKNNCLYDIKMLLERQRDYKDCIKIYINEHML